jgi:anthranilate/para-aminobenzoate synthase component I
VARLYARVISRAPDAFGIAAALRDRPGFALIRSPATKAWYAACDHVDESGSLDPDPGLVPQPSTRDLASVPRWIGVVPYEARRGLERESHDPRPAPPLIGPVWQRYAAVVEIAARVRVVGEDPERVDELAARLARPVPTAPEAELRPRGTPEPDRIHAERVRAALEHIAKGDVYVVNLARLFQFHATGDPLSLLTRLLRRAPAPFAAALSLPKSDVISTSPELLLRTFADGRATTRPIKGTRPRGSDSRSDARLVSELEHDEKERAELAMVVDVERNDLGRVARVGSVRQLGEPRVTTHATVHHRSVELTAHVRPDVSRTALLEAMLPSGSVTGAPKIRAMELIATLEAERRGLYTGAIGLLRHDGTLELSMAIRTLTLTEGVGRYFAGGGIVADSDPDREVEETRWKAIQVLG